MQSWIRETSWEQEEATRINTTRPQTRSVPVASNQPSHFSQVVVKTNKFRQELKAKQAENRKHEQARLDKEKYNRMKFDKYALETAKDIIQDTLQGPTRREPSISTSKYERKKALYDAQHPVAWNGRHPKSREAIERYPFLHSNKNRGPHGSDLKKSARGSSPHLKREKRRTLRRTNQGVKHERFTKLGKSLFPITEDDFCRSRKSSSQRAQ
eukprot:TRINITY_DN9602_c1_g2_i1.p1 TRINITY_DN9602_c1_g2~~TRINITY_DN9602_c1_g2_i1.p1  ORF type:complete len:233 (+),score=29.11 TRINITY_DN9602_c1_g2_i1:66-701(+)